jgi:FkbM family methyltransferase
MLENDREGLQSFLSSPELYGNKDTCPWVMNAAAFREFWGKLFRVLALHRVPLAAKREAMFRAAQGDPLPDVFFDMLGVDDCLPLRDGVLYVPDRHSAWILLNEILADQDYAFPTSCRNPRIIDCGAHCGVAVYFFKSRYPDAVITCFEPLESLRSLLHKNILANEYENVDVQPYALAGGEGKAKFYTVQRDSMAGSLGTRRQEYEDDLIEIEVTTVRLSDYLNEPVQMLKLDVEGAELEVLCECRHKLGMVENIFVEYHEDGANKYDGKLPRVLSILDEAGFMCRVDTPRGETSRQGVACVGKPYSISIWGRRVPGAQE